MATQVQFRRGTSVQHTSFTGAAGEVTVNTTNKSVHVHDGTTANGFELARADLSNTSGLSLSGLTTVTDLSISRNLYVSGVSTFVGNVTFQGGTISLGDSNTDNVVFTADVNSNIIPNTDNTYDFGNVSQRWRNANFAGIVTSTSFVGALTGNVNSTGVSTFVSLTSTNINASGVTTSSGGFVGNVTGNINSSGVSTFSSLTSTNINASGVTTSTGGFVGSLTGNVSGNLSGNVNSTGVSTFVSLTSTNVNASGVTTSTGGFVGALTGNVTGNATGLSGNPSITVTNVTVNGVLSVGGTSVVLNAQQLQINDRDITLGITTDVNGNNVANDTTANHGGIAIASTVGTPIINMPVDGVNTDLPTYKQIMWVKQNHYSGFGTDAWVFNYGVSIGNTATVQNGSRLTVGAGFTVYDTYIDTLDIKARNISASGITTSSGGFVGNITGDVNSSGVSTFSTINVGSAVVVSTSTTTTTTSATSVASISASTYRSAVFQVQAVQGTTYNMTTINVIHDGTETYMTEYGTINQPVGIATFATDISAGSLRLLSYPSSTSSTTFRVVTTATQI